MKNHIFRSFEKSKNSLISINLFYTVNSAIVLSIFMRSTQLGNQSLPDITKRESDHSRSKCHSNRAHKLHIQTALSPYHSVHQEVEVPIKENTWDTQSKSGQKTRIAIMLDNLVEDISHSFKFVFSVFIRQVEGVDLIDDIKRNREEKSERIWEHIHEESGGNWVWFHLFG